MKTLGGGGIDSTHSWPQH